MPLIKSKSKKAFEKNVETEMEANPGKEHRAQNLAIAYSVKRKAKKKMAEGGAVSAKTEKRPMPDQTTNSSKMTSQNTGDKPLKESGWTDRPDIAQSQRGPKTERIKHPKMVKSDILQIRLRDEEDDLQNSAGTNEGPQTQPPKVDDETDATKRGKSPEKQTAISTGKQVMAKGGKVEASDYDDTDPNAATDSSMNETPSEDEGESMAMSHNEEHQEQTSGDPDDSEPHSDDIDTYKYAEGGEVEQETEHHDSIVAAIMANRERAHADIDSGARDLDEAVRMASGGTVASGSEDMNYAEGGQVDIDDNNNEEPNAYPPMNGDALDDRNEDIRGMEQPEDSNETGDEREDERSDKHDMISSIRRKMKSKQKFSDN